MIVLALVYSALAGIAAALVVCRAVRLSLPMDVFLGASSVLLMSEAAKMSGDHAWPLAALFAGYGVAVLAMRHVKATTPEAA